jgi:hypothetical protein
VIREIPSFADLLLLPAVIDRDARTFIKGDGVAVLTSTPREIQSELEQYPHVDISFDDDGDMLLRAKDGGFKRLIFEWPSGKMLGVLLWDRGYYTTTNPKVMESLLASGLSVETVRCLHRQNFKDALRMTSKRLHP